jgi:hypothetical protein
MVKRDHPRPQPKDAKKSAKIDEARIRRTARRKLEKTTDAGREVTAEMVSTALTKRSINQVDALTRNKSSQQPARSWNQPNRNPPDSSIGMLPYKALKKHVAWLTPQQQDAAADTSLTAELLAFSKYVEVRNSSFCVARTPALHKVSTLVTFSLQTAGRPRARCQAEHAAGHPGRRAEQVPLG